MIADLIVSAAPDACCTWLRATFRLAKMSAEAEACAAFMAAFASRPFAPSSFANALLPDW